MGKERRTWDMPTPPEEKARKAAQKEKKLKKAELEQRLRKAQQRRMWWELVLEQNDGIVAAIDRKIEALQARKQHLINEKAMAPEKLKAADAECQQWNKKLHVTPDLDKKVAKMMKLHLQLRRLMQEAKMVDLSPESIALLKRSMTTTSTAGQ